MNQSRLTSTLLAFAVVLSSQVYASETPKKEIIRATYATGEVTKLCQEAMAKAKTRLDTLAKSKAQKKTFGATTLQLEKTFADLSDETLPLTYMGYVSPNQATRAEGSDCEEKVSQFNVAQFTRKDLYNLIKDVKPSNAAETRLQEQIMLSFEKSGLKLPEDKLAQVRELKTKLASLEAQFSKNLNEDTTTFVVTEKDLEGVPADYVASLKRDASGGLIVGTRESDSSMILMNAKNPATRKAFLDHYYNRAPQNTKLLQDAVALRQQIASLMGYATWADYRIKGNMAQNGTTALELLTRLKGKLAEKNKSDLAKLLEAKRKLEAPNATAIEPWDVNYFANQIKKTELNVDEEKVREYFPKDTVVQGMFSVYAQLLGVRYEEVKDAIVWSPDVKLYAIREKKNDAIIGYFYTDLAPRQGKYGHAAAFPLIAGRKLDNGKYSVPVAGIVANLNGPANGKPALLSHDDVETLFHEFGHIMHQTLTRAPYAWLSGSSVAQDFVEAPSQMLENWVWDAQVLAKLSGHYTDTSKKLPPELLAQMLKARDFNQGYYYTRQLTLGLTDMAMHTAAGPVDVNAVYNQTYKETLGIEPLADNNFMASFGHMMGGYDAGYYGYLWSKVYAEDMFTRFEKAGLLSPSMGAHYRKTILEKGNMIEAIDLVTEFLGRKPSTAAFYKRLGISAK